MSVGFSKGDPSGCQPPNAPAEPAQRCYSPATGLSIAVINRQLINRH
jgi:hypothetical protein